MSTRQVWGEFTLDSEPTENSHNPVESGGVANSIANVNETIKKGVISRKSVRYGYTILGTVSVTDTAKNLFLAIDVYCCERIQNPVKLEALISYVGDVYGSYKCTATTSPSATRFKLSWRMASDSSANLPKIEIWLIDTQSSGQTTRRQVGYNIHMITGMLWTDGTTTTETLPAGLTDFTLSFNSSN